MSGFRNVQIVPCTGHIVAASKIYKLVYNANNNHATPLMCTQSVSNEAYYVGYTAIVTI